VVHPAVSTQMMGIVAPEKATPDRIVLNFHNATSSDDLGGNSFNPIFHNLMIFRFINIVISIYTFLEK
jgi:hypothetical protein